MVTSALPSTKSNEWYTPARYIEAARVVMGSIDLDPASCELANQTVRATRYYTKEENGLTQSWHGNVWLNPPFGYTSGKSNIKIFTEKLLDEYQASNIEQAILLSTVRTDTKWFFRLWEYPICIADHKVAFVRPDQGHAWHWQGTIFVYLGPHEQKFIEVFSQFGTIAKRVSPPKSAPSTLWEVAS